MFFSTSVSFSIIHIFIWILKAKNYTESVIQGPVHFRFIWRDRRRFLIESTEFVLRTEENYSKRVEDQYGVLHGQRWVMIDDWVDGVTIFCELTKINMYVFSSLSMRPFQPLIVTNEGYIFMWDWWILYFKFWTENSDVLQHNGWLDLCVQSWNRKGRTDFQWDYIFSKLSIYDDTPLSVWQIMSKTNDKVHKIICFYEHVEVVLLWF